MYSMERTGAFQFKGPVTLVGPELKVGDTAPRFTVVGNDLSTVDSQSFAGKVRIINSVPSLDTPVCDAQTRRFNEAAAALGENVVVLTISMDLPFAQKRWCGAAGVDRVITLSDFRDASFSQAFGTYIKEWRLLSRAVFVVDAQDKIVYAEYVPAAAEHPNYAAALEAARAALEG
jgi:thiol peroxidase